MNPKNAFLIALMILGSLTGMHWDKQGAMGISEKNAEWALQGFALAVSFVLMVWILVSALDLLFKLILLNSIVYSLVSAFYPYKKCPQYKHWQVAWGIASLLLLLLQLLVETGRLWVAEPIAWIFDAGVRQDPKIIVIAPGVGKTCPGLFGWSKIQYRGL
jgi:hypothetical protein